MQTNADVGWLYLEKSRYLVRAHFFQLTKNQDLAIPLVQAIEHAIDRCSRLVALDPA